LPDGKRAITGSWDGTIKIWDLGSRSDPGTIEVKSPVAALALAAKASTIAVGLPDGTIVLYDLATRGETARYRRHESAVRGLSFTRDGARLVSSDAGGTVLVWHLSPGSEPDVGRMDRPPRAVTSLAYDADEDGPFVGTEDGAIQHYSRATKVALEEKGPEGALRGLACDHAHVLLGTQDGSVVLRDAATLQLLDTFHFHRGPVLAVAISPDGKRGVSGGDDGELRFWDLDRRAPTGPTLSPAAERLALSPDGKQLLTGNGKGAVALWDLETGKPRWTLASSSKKLFCVSLSPDGKLAAAVGEEPSIEILDAATGKRVTSYAAPGAVYRAVFFSDGKTLATAGDQGRIQLRDLASGATRELEGHTGTVFCLAELPDGRLVSGSTDRTIRFWDTTALREESRIDDAHKELVGNVVLSPDGKRLLSTSWDHTIKVWDATTRVLLQEIPAHPRVTWGAAFLDERRAVLGCFDGTIDIVDVTAGACLDEISLASSRDWTGNLLLARDRRSFFAGTQRGVVLRFEVAGR
jgi:WD40 repeat protein